MSKISIKIIIAGRNYPLTINEEEEDLVRQAVKEINTNIKKLQENYAVKDMQDLLAMTALQLATRSNSNENSGEIKNDQAVNKTEIINALQLLSNSIEV